MSEPISLHGRSWVLHAFDIGDWVSLPRTRELLQAASIQQAARTRRAPSDFGLDPQPVVWESDSPPLTLAGRSIPLRMRAVVYDFGVISISLSFDFSGALKTWRDLSDELFEHAELLTRARQIAETLVERIKAAIDDPRFSKIYENYSVFQIDPPAGISLEQWMASERSTLAQTLRGEVAELSAEEIEESLDRRITYEVNDLAIIDWNSAIVVDRDYEDTLAVLELANAQLLEMRILDDRLDDVLEEAYRTIRKRGFQWPMLFRSYPTPMRRLAELMADAAAEFESVNNAIKLTNDQYLARVYRIAAKRFQLIAFDADINRKLDSLWEIQSVFTEAASVRRLEVLEWIVIILITVELIHSLV